MRAAVYARVSTEDQEKEGTSLQSQEEACLKKAHELGFEVLQGLIFKETYSGLTLDRPQLTKLRELIRRGDIDTIVAYTLDRLSRDPVHIIILQDEFERVKVRLTLVTETLDSSDLGKLITYIKGYAAKLEAEKIGERSIRGKRTKCLQGKISSGSHARLYGYYYIAVARDGGGIRVVNEDEAKWVRQIYKWLVEEGLSINIITYRLRELGVVTPSGKGFWIRSTVHKILSNPAYMGKTYAFTQTYGEPKYRMKTNVKRRKSGRIWKPKTEWIEIPNVTPPIISSQVFEAAQKQLERNRQLASRNCERQYLLHGHIYCGHCGRGYWAKTSKWQRGTKHYERRYYGCSGNLKIVSPVRCGARNLNANEIEKLVWHQIETLLCQPEIVLAEFERRKQEANAVTFLEKDLEAIELRLERLRKRDEKLLRGWLWGQDEDFIEKEKIALDKEKRSLESEKESLLKRMQASKQSNISLDKVEEACRLIGSSLKTLNFEEKRLILEILLIKVSVVDADIRIEGCIPLPSLEIVSTVSGWHHLDRY